MEATAGTAGIEPAVGTTTAHLTIDHYTTSPRAMSFVAVFTCRRREITSNMRKKSLDVTASAKVELLLGPPLLCETKTRLPRQALCECTLNVKRAVSRVAS